MASEREEADARIAVKKALVAVRLALAKCSHCEYSLSNVISPLEDAAESVRYALDVLDGKR